MMPGITNLPLRSRVVAPLGTLSCAIGPTQAILPSVITIAELGAAGLPVPSITVTLLSTVVSAPAGTAVNATANKGRGGGAEFQITHLQLPFVFAAHPCPEPSTESDGSAFASPSGFDSSSNFGCLNRRIPGRTLGQRCAKKKAPELRCTATCNNLKRQHAGGLREKNAAFRLEGGTNFAGWSRVMFSIQSGGRIS